MNALSALVMVAALGQTPVDPAELAKAQASLEAYYGRIKAIQLTYTQQFIEPKKPREIRDPLASLALPGTVPLADPKLVDDHELLYAFPSTRMKVLERRKYEEGKVTEHERETRVHKGKLIQIDYTHKSFDENTKLDYEPFPSLPLDALGLRLPASPNLPLSEFLKHPDITSLEGEDKIDGERVIVLKIGPKFPDSVRPKYWSEDSFLKVWLAPEHSYLPLRWEYHSSFDKQPAVWKYSLASLKSIEDKATGDKVSFPTRLDVEWPSGGRTSWVVKSAIINPKVSEEDFVLSPPAGYFVAVDGKPRGIGGSTTAPSEADEKGKSGPLSVTVVNDQGQPVAGAKLALWGEGHSVAETFFGSQDKPLAEATTDENGKAAFGEVPGGYLSATLRHPEYRTRGSILSIENPIVTLRLSPQTPVVVRDEQGRPVKDAFVACNLLLLKDHWLAPVIPELAARTAADGTAQITWEVPQRRDHYPCPFLAVESGGRMAIAVRTAGDLRAPVELTLRPTRLVRVTVDVGRAAERGPPVRWTDEKGRTFYSGASEVQEGDPERFVHPGRFVAQLRLPLGKYQVLFIASQEAEEAIVPFEVTPGDGDLDLGVVNTKPSKLVQLIGHDAPEFSLRWRDNENRRLADLKGKVVVLNFWATWCGPCIAKMPEMIDLREKLASEPIEWIAIHDASIEAFADLDEQLADLEKRRWNGRQLSWRTVLDEPDEDSGQLGATIARYGVRYWPTIVLIDQQGKAVGPVEKEQLEPAIRKLLEKP